ncbi:conjugal transfer protein TraH [Thiomicrorhabdus aquaedulcis]|uniref:conjugal transfer protein TraH n=1 Tax=Thiomicrorhabdus aquaedulcis TaxID=2211106 RepID=UPI000FD7044F|nr:conjugal transfer protein TraH [Thiomicrorhabdus aquaedulcis]
MKTPIVKLNKLLVGMALAMTVSTSAHASLSDMQSFFNEVGVYGNASGANTFQGQTRNYITGGSLTVRIPQKNYQLATFDPPRLSASCGGIDAFAGSFSFINSEQLVQMLQNIGNNAAGAVFQLAMDSVAPQLGAVLKYFQDMANKINALNVNSCEAAKGIVLAGQNGSLQNGFFNDMKEMGSNVLGVAQDWSGIKESFDKDPKEVTKTKDSLIGSSSPLSEDEKFWVSPGNLLWRAMDKVTTNGGGLSNDEKHIIQALVGTVIIKDGSGDTPMPEAAHELPMFLSPLEAFMGTDPSSQVVLPIYTCSDVQTCKTVSNTGQTVRIKSLRNIIHEKMQKTQEKIMNRSGGVTLDDYEVVNMSFLPVWTMMESEYRTGGVLGTLNAAEEVIALAYTAGLLKRTLKSVHVALQATGKAKNEGIQLAVKQLEAEIYRVNSEVDRGMQEAMVRFSTYTTAKQSLEFEVKSVKERTAQQLFAINRTR